MTSFSIDHILGINNNTDDASNQQHFIASAALPQHQQPIHFWNYPAVPVHPVIVSPNDCYWPSPVAAAAAWFIQQQQQHQQVIHGIRNSSRAAVESSSSSSAGNRKGGQIRFTHRQSHLLEETFATNRYLTPTQRRSLAQRLGLSERQVKTWFQNRRAKWRRTIKEDTASSNNFEDCDEANNSSSSNDDAYCIINERV